MDGLQWLSNFDDEELANLDLLGFIHNIVTTYLLLFSEAQNPQLQIAKPFIHC